MRVQFDALRCGSAFTMGVCEPNPLLTGRRGGREADVRLVELGDVLYLPNVLETGQSLCVARDGTVPVESVLDCWSVDFFRARKLERAYAAIYAGDFAPESLPGRVCVLGNLFSRNFGHWSEELLKVAVLEQAGVACRYVIPTLPRFALEWLRFIGVGADRVEIVDRPTVLHRAVFTSAVSHQNIAEYPEVLELFRDLIRSVSGTSVSRFGQRLWLERTQSSANGGTTVNKEEVYRTLEGYGFSVVEMSALSVAEQVATARSATVIAGPHGSQFVHAQLMPEASTVIECFSPTHVNPSILQICRALRHDYRQIVARSHIIAPYAHGRDCVVDCDHLRLVLDGVSA